MSIEMGGLMGRRAQDILVLVIFIMGGRLMYSMIFGAVGELAGLTEDDALACQAAAVQHLASCK